MIAGGVFLQLLYGSRRARAKLGTDGTQLLVMLPSGETLTVAAERLIYDQRSIAFDDHAYVLAPLYEREEVQSYLAPLLSRATKVSSFEMQRYRLAHRDGGLIAGYLFLLLCIAVLFVSGALWAGALKGAGAGQEARDRLHEIEGALELFSSDPFVFRPSDLYMICCVSATNPTHRSGFPPMAMMISRTARAILS